MTAKHEHQFDSIKMIDAKIDNPKFSIGESGAWSFLVRYCECGREEAFDYLRRKDAEERLNQLIGG